jgi:hypothetical protein
VVQLSSFCWAYLSGLHLKEAEPRPRNAAISIEDRAADNAQHCDSYVAQSQNDALYYVKRRAQEIPKQLFSLHDVMSC